MALKDKVHAASGFACGDIICFIATAVRAYHQLYVFGDNLSDTGHTGQFTCDSNKNLLFEEAILTRIGVALVPSGNAGDHYATDGSVAVPALNPAEKTQD